MVKIQCLAILLALLGIASAHAQCSLCPGIDSIAFSNPSPCQGNSIDVTIYFDSQASSPGVNKLGLYYTSVASNYDAPQIYDAPNHSNLGVNLIADNLGVPGSAGGQITISWVLPPNLSGVIRVYAILGSNSPCYSQCNWAGSFSFTKRTLAIGSPPDFQVLKQECRADPDSLGIVLSGLSNANLSGNFACSNVPPGQQAYQYQIHYRINGGPVQTFHPPIMVLTGGGLGFRLSKMGLAHGDQLEIVKINNQCNGCSQTFSFANELNLVLDPMPGLALGLLGDTVCAGDQAIIGIANSLPGDEYQLWALGVGPVGSFVPGNGGLLPLPVPSLMTHSYQVRVKRLASGCEDLTNDVVEARLKPSLEEIDLLGDTSICHGQKVRLKVLPPSNVNDDIWVTINEDTSYQVFAFNGNPQTLNVFPETDSTFSITRVRYQEGLLCETVPRPNQVVVNVLPDLSQAKLEGLKEVCIGDSAFLTIKVPSHPNQAIRGKLMPLNFNFVLDPGIESLEIGVLPTQTTTYRIEEIYLLDDSECEQKNVASHTVKLRDPPLADFEHDNALCFSQEICFSGQPGPMPTGSYQFLWDFNGEGNASGESPCFTFEDYEAEKHISLAVADELGCTSSLNRILNLDLSGPPPPVMHRIYKANDPGVIIWAEDTSDNGEQVEYYQWLDQQGNFLSDPDIRPYIYRPGLRDSVRVAIKYQSSPCITQSAVSRYRGDLDPESVPAVLKVMPNPNHGTFQLLLSGPVLGQGSLRIFNLNGQLEWQEELAKDVLQLQTKLSLSLAPGLYFLQYRQDRGPILQSRLFIH